MKTTARGFEKATLAVLDRLGIEVEELERWNCCGTVTSLASDNLMNHLGAFRNLIRAQEGGYKRVVSFCSMCYSTLKMVDRLVNDDQEKLKTINSFMDREVDYTGGIEVIHLVDLLTEMGEKALAGKTIRKLPGLKVAPYYGCALVRPRSVSIDEHPDDPTVIEDVLRSMGVEVVDFPYRTECCGAHNSLENRVKVKELTRNMVLAARRREADIIALSCPLCHYNLDALQDELVSEDGGFVPVPIVYISQIIGLTLGMDPSELGLDGHAIDPLPVLQEVANGA